MIKKIGKFILYFFAAVFLTPTLSKIGVPEGVDIIAATGIVIAYYFISKKKQTKNELEVKAAAQITKQAQGVVFTLEGPQDFLDVYQSKITLTPKKHLSVIINKGVVGSKNIPFSSITAIQLKLAETVNGYIQFSLLGGIESRGGLFAAAIDENTCLFFKKDNNLAIQIRDYIELRIGELRNGSGASSDGLCNEISGLAKLRAEGLLTDEEFANAKASLISK